MFVCLSVCLSLRVVDEFWWITGRARRVTMRKRGTSCRPVSVCLSVTLVYCIQTANDIIRLLSQSGSLISLHVVSWGHPMLTNSKRKPLSGGVTYMGVAKICDFWLNSPFRSETVRGGPMVAIGSHGSPVDLYRFRWLCVTLKGGTRGSFFKGGSS